MKTAILLALGVCALTACGGGSLPQHPAMPITSVDDQGDEWLYDHCAVKKVVRLDNEKVEDAALAAHSNFVEIVYADPGHSDVVMFDCKEAVPHALVGSL